MVEALQDATWGLPGTEVPVREPYKPKWSLDFAGQPSFGVGVGPFGTYAAGGVSFLFSDMLGNHVIGTSAQVTSRFDEFGGSVFYLNRTHRWNWGAVARPDALRVSAASSPASRGTPTSSRSIGTCSVISRLTGFLSYPFSRSGESRLRRLSSHRPELRPDGADLHLAGSAADRRQNPLRDLSDAEPRRGHHGARLRHVDLSARPARFEAAATAWSSRRAPAR